MDDEDTCLICLENIENIDHLVFPKHCKCKVKMHLQCLNQINKIGMLCPICRIKKNNPNIQLEIINNEGFITMLPLNLFLRYPNFITFAIYLLFSVFITLFYVIPLIIIYGLYDQAYRRNIITGISIVTSGFIISLIIFG